MINDHWHPTSPIGTTMTPELTAGTQVWCATREGRTLCCQVRETPEGSSWEVLMKTGVDTTRPPWFVRWLRGEERRVVDCCRESKRLLLTRACANEATARFVALALKGDYLRVGWVECCAL